MSPFPSDPIRSESIGPVDWLKLGAGALRLALGASATRPRQLGPTFRRAVQLLGRERFRRGEIRSFGLLADGAGDLRGGGSPVPAVSRRAMERIAAAYNPVDARAGLRDKGEFHRACERLGLPVPALIGLFRPDRSACVDDETTANDPASARRLIEARCPEDFVVKPIRGGYGHGVRVFRRIGSARFLDSTGIEMDSTELVEWMRGIGGIQGCVIQARVFGAPEIERMSGTRHLQTARLMTMLDLEGEPHLLHAYFKLIAGTNAIDNFQRGKTGNLLALPSLDQGILGKPLTLAKGGGSIVVDRHPETGAPFEGFAIPGWEGVRALALRAARAFAPLRLVGWDIAPTAEGPILIEGNWNADPPNLGGQIDRVIAEIQRLA